MKIAVLSDIHGNYDALAEVLSAARRQNVERLFILGDTVGYYYQPHNVFAALSEWRCDFIAGNHEQALIASLSSESSRQQYLAKYGSGVEACLEQLTTKQLDFIRAMPTSTSIELDGQRFDLHHGSPHDPDEYIYPDCDQEKLKELIPSQDVAVLLGHTHYHFFYQHNGGTVFNPGSVGQSRETGGLASWGIINTENNSFSHKSTPYDTTQLIKDALDRDPNLEYLHKILKRH
ncbi:MAG: metallophosphoesterase family protein [Alphaproteobacteria bacterium]|nr:metallophosphoesterase family protein [Alphaproteobacteria bacterium]